MGVATGPIKYACFLRMFVSWAANKYNRILHRQE